MRNGDKAVWAGLAVALWTLGLLVAGRHGATFAAIGWAAVALGVYVMLGVLFDLPLPRSGPSPEDQVVINGLSHLIEDGRDFLREMQETPGDYTRAYGIWVRHAEEFIAGHFTPGHLVKFRSILGLEGVGTELPNQQRLLTRYVIRLEGFKREREGR